MVRTFFATLRVPVTALFHQRGLAVREADV
jgi:hypothetical protein